MRSAVLLLAAALPAPAAAGAASPAGPSAPDPTPASDVIVRYAPGADAAERAKARADADVRHVRALPVARMVVVDPEPGVSVAAAVHDLEREASVLYAEPDHPRVRHVVPDDPLLGDQWGLRSTGQRVNGLVGTADADIDADDAWNMVTGTRAQVVAVLDSGMNTGHPDLASNVWANDGELPDNAFDDDGNGFVDDVAGYDFVDDDGQPLDGDGHGTHVAGTIGARGANATGVTGVAWNVSLMAVRVLDDGGSGTVSDLIAGYTYAARNGARVLNASLGGQDASQAERDAIGAAPDVLFVAAAGNDRDDNDIVSSVPCDYDLANIVCVAATDREDELASFSSFGVQSVDLAAPGVDILSTDIPRDYRFLDGTSMAAPHVSGTAALALAVNPSLSTAQLRDVLLRGADPVPGLAGRVATGARLNAAGTVGLAAAIPIAAPSTPSAPAPGPAQDAPGLVSARPLPVATASRAADDDTAPVVTIRIGTARPSLSALRSPGLRVRVRCSEACRVSSGRLELDATSARRAGLSRRIASARGSALRTGTHTVTLRIGPRTRSRLARRASTRAVVRISVRDRAGNTRTRSMRVTLRR